MEFVQGESLRERIVRKGRLRPLEAATIILHAAEGLGLAHRRGVVHRDVKPDNILVSRSGDVKVVDLGLAKATTLDESITRMGMMMGTPQYTPPEQWRDASKAGPPADVWALGATLWFLLTGESAFDGGAPLSIGLRIVKDRFPAIQDVRPEIPGTLADILEQATQAEPEDRYQDGASLAAALSAFLLESGGAPSLADPEAGSHHHRVLDAAPPSPVTLQSIRGSIAASEAQRLGGGSDALGPEAGIGGWGALPSVPPRRTTPVGRRRLTPHLPKAIGWSRDSAVPAGRLAPSAAGEPASEVDRRQTTGSSSRIGVHDAPDPTLSPPSGVPVSRRSVWLRRSVLIAVFAGASYGLVATAPQWRTLFDQEPVPGRLVQDFEALVPVNAKAVMRMESVAFSREIISRVDGWFPGLLRSDRPPWLLASPETQEAPVQAGVCAGLAAGFGPSDGGDNISFTWIVPFDREREPGGDPSLRARKGDWVAFHDPQDAYQSIGSTGSLARDLPEGDLALVVASGDLARGNDRPRVDRKWAMALDAMAGMTWGEVSPGPVLLPLAQRTRELFMASSTMSANGGLRDGALQLDLTVSLDSDAARHAYLPPAGGFQSWLAAAHGDPTLVLGLHRGDGQPEACLNPLITGLVARLPADIREGARNLLTAWDELIDRTAPATISSLRVVPGPGGSGVAGVEWIHVVGTADPEGWAKDLRKSLERLREVGIAFSPGMTYTVGSHLVRPWTLRADVNYVPAFIDLEGEPQAEREALRQRRERLLEGVQALLHTIAPTGTAAIHLIPHDGRVAIVLGDQALVRHVISALEGGGREPAAVAGLAAAAGPSAHALFYADVDGVRRLAGLLSRWLGCDIVLPETTLQSLGVYLQGGGGSAVRLGVRLR
jgi:hypothetical protein